jgi:ribonuclease J
VKGHTSVGKIENWSTLKSALRDEIGAFLFQKTERRPLVLPVVIEV